MLITFRVDTPLLAHYCLDMTNTESAALLFIEPANDATEALVDDITCLGAAVLNAAVVDETSYCRGVHTCTGCRSAHSANYTLDVGGCTTNTLLVHYLAFHRSEVPADEISKVTAIAATLGLTGTAPTAKQLTPSMW